MLCFGGRRKHSKKKERFSRRQSEAPLSRISNCYTQPRYDNNNINVPQGQHRVLVVDGHSLRIVNTPNRRTYTDGPGNIRKRLHDYTQGPDYEYVCYTDNKVMTRRPVSLHNPIQSQLNCRERIRPYSQVLDSTLRYVYPKGSHSDWETVESKNKPIRYSPHGLSMPRETVTWQSVNHYQNGKDNVEQARADLDDTLNSFCLEGLDSDSSDDGLDKLKYGERITSSIGNDSGIHSPTDSLSSHRSLHGIITHDEHKTGSKRKRASVSFELPPNHVDKPYSPIQFSKSKAKSRHRNYNTDSSYYSTLRRL